MPEPNHGTIAFLLRLMTKPFLLLRHVDDPSLSCTTSPSCIAKPSGLTLVVPLLRPYRSSDPVLTEHPNTEQLLLTEHERL
jgi:hypothetical protein